MAAPERKSQQRAQHFRKRLEELECPYIQGVDDSWIEELLFKPGEPRIRLLQWLLGRFDPDISEMLENPSGVTVGKIDSRLQRILFVSNLLSLCRSDDVDLIRGSSSKSKQSVFLGNLLDLVSVVDKSEMHPSYPHPSTPGRTRNQSLDDQFEKDCWFVDALCREEDLSEVFKTRVQLFPADMSRHFPKGKAASHVVPDNKHLISVAEQLANELDSQTKQLEELKEKYPMCSADPQTVQQISTKLGLSLSTLSQVVNGFLHCYESEMKPWSNRAQPELTEIGPCFQRVHRLLQHFITLLDSLSLLKTSYTHLCRSTTSDQASMKPTELAPISRSAIENLQDCVNVLEESILRQREHPT